MKNADMKRDSRHGVLENIGQQCFFEDRVGSARLRREPEMFDSENGSTLPNSQDWGQHSPWASNAPSFQIDQKRLALLSEPSISQRHGAHYWPYMNPCPQQDGMGLKPGNETWSYPANIPPTTMAATSSSGLFSGRNSEMIRPNPHGLPLPRPPHHLFTSGVAPMPLSEGGPPSLPPPLLHHPFSFQLLPQDRSNRTHTRYPWETPPSYCTSQTTRQRAGVDTPPRFSTSGNTVFPPSSLVHYDSISTAPLSTLPYYSASPFGMLPSSNFRSNTNLHPGIQNPDSMVYADHGCYSLPVTTATSDPQSQINQTNRPYNLYSKPAAKQSATVAPIAPVPSRKGHHRRTLSDPGLQSLLSNVVPSNPPPPPPLRLDGWLKGKSLRCLGNRIEDDQNVSSAIPDTNRWFHSSEERKEQRLEQNKVDEDVLRSNTSGHSSSGSDLSGAPLQPVKSSASGLQHDKISCCCSSWPSPKKLAEEVLALKEANRKLCRELRETRKELDDLKVMLPNPGLIKHNNVPLSWQCSGMDYQPGMISELIQEVRDAARLREEAFLSHIHSSIVTQGSSCGCGQALFQEGENLNKTKLACWWWGKSHQTQNKSWQQQSPQNCSPLSSSVIGTSKKGSIPGLTELECLKERLQQVQEEKDQTSTRLKKVEEKLSNWKFYFENHIEKNKGPQESDLHSHESEQNSQKKNSSPRQECGASKNEEALNQEVAVLKDDVQKLRLQLQDISTTKDTIGQVQKIEQLTALLQKVIYPSNGISVNGAGSAILSTIGCCPSVSEEVVDNLHSDALPLASKANNSDTCFDDTFHSVTSANISRSEDCIVKQRVVTESSPPNSIESDCSISSCSNNCKIVINSGPPPVTMHGPVTDL